MSSLISEYYLKENQRLHEDVGGFGVGGYKWLPVVTKMVEHHGIKTLLDYGCGKGTLKRKYPGKLDIREYDPAIPEKASMPEPAQLVVCTDVLEHIEPDLLDNIISHIESVTEVMVLFGIATRPSDKYYSDGSNVHVIIEDDYFWRNKLLEHFSKVTDIPPLRPGEYAAVCRP